jgi:hypothetical protein
MLEDITGDVSDDTVTIGVGRVLWSVLDWSYSVGASRATSQRGCQK